MSPCSSIRSLFALDDYQQNYFVIDRFDDLRAQTREANLDPFYGRLRGAAPIEASETRASDRIIHAGTQAYARGKARA